MNRVLLLFNERGDHTGSARSTRRMIVHSFPPPVYWEGKLRQRKGGGRKRGAHRPDRWESKLGPHERFVPNFGQVCEALQTQIRGGGWREGGSAGWQALAPKRRRRRRHRSNGRLGLPPPQHVAAAASCRTCPRTHPTWPRPLPRASPPASSWPST